MAVSEGAIVMTASPAAQLELKPTAEIRVGKQPMARFFRPGVPCFSAPQGKHIGFFDIPKGGP